MKRKGFLGGIFAMALILVLTLVLSVGSVSAAEPTIVDSGNCGKDGSNVTWTLDSNGLLTISGTGKMADYEDKTDSVSGEVMTTAPWGNRAKRVVIEDSVTSIGNYAFSGCTGLTSATIPDSVTSIGGYAFSSCTGLTSATIPDSVTSIGGYAFSACRGLTSVKIPNSVTRIGDGAFYYCTGLREVIYNAKAVTNGDNVFEDAGTASDGMKVVFGESVEKIPSYLFCGCTGLTSVTIPDSVTSIGWYAFSGCTSLKEVIYNAKAVADLTDGGDKSNVFGDSGTAADGMKVVFGESVEKVPAYLFYNCKGLTSVTIGSNVTSIGYRAFSGCTGLTGVTIPDSVTSIGADAFCGCMGLTSVVIPDSVKNIGIGAFHYCTSLTSVTMGSGVTDIGNLAFWQCTALTDVTLGSSVTVIGEQAFNSCEKLTDIVIPDSVTTIGEYAFVDCGSLAKVTIGTGVTDIGWEAFSGCTKLAEINYNAKAAADLRVTVDEGLTVHYADVFKDAGTSVGGVRVKIGDGVERIPAYLFKDCTGLTGSVMIPNSVTDIGWYAFADCTGLTGVTIPNSVTSIGSSVFSGCKGLTSVAIGSSVTSIGGSAFFGCRGLTSMTIPDSVTSIGRGTFSGCTGLKEVIYNAKAADLESYSEVFENAGTAADGMKVVFGESVEKIPAYLFYNCTGLTSVTIGSNVTSIGESAFSGCTSLTSVTIPDSVTSIGDGAFFRCTSLTGVTIPDSVTSIGRSTFYGCTGLTSVTIPDSVTSIENYAFYNCTGLTNVEIPNSVTSIVDEAFYGCTGLKGVIYNAKAAADLTEYSRVFEGAGTAADGMKVVFGESVEKIPDYLFYNCTGLTSVTIGRNVTSIGDNAFYGCTNLTEIYYNAKDADLTYNSNVFGGAGTAADGMKVIFGESVEKIHAKLFSGCTGLTSVTIGSNVISIEDEAFKNCNNIEEVHITDIAAWCGIHFWNYDSNPLGYSKKLYVDDVLVTNLTIPSGVTSIGGRAFSGCMGLTGVTIPDSVTSIGDRAFSGCTGLTSVTIGNSVTSIGYEAFSGCTDLKEVIYNAKVAADLTNYSNVFENAGTTADGMKVIFGESVKKIPAYLFYGSNIQKIEFAGDPPVVGNGAWESNRSIYAYYPMHNSAWTNSARIACGSSLVWRGYCYEPLSSGICKINKTVYMTGDTLDDYSISMEVTHKDGCTETIPYDSGLLELGSCDMSTPGAKTIDVTYRGTTAQLKIYVHERKTQTLDKKGYPESSHNYENNLDKTYTYKAAGAVSLDVTFSAQTEVETNIDYIYVNGAQYTGTELAGKTISIQGDTLTIRLVSDKSDSAYGFSIDRIVKTYMEHQYENGVCTLCGAKDPNFKPAAPTAKPSYVGASGKPYIYWGAVDGANRYYVYRSTTKDGTYSFLGSTENLNYTDSKADAGTTYYYKVKAGIVNGVKSNSSAAVAITCRCARPVVKPSYVGASGKPYIYWSAVDGANRYYVYRSTTKDGTYTLLGTTTSLNYTDSTANAGYTYYYKVKALTADGTESDFSAAVAGTCHCARPTVTPDYLTSTGKPYLKWAAVAGASKYEVYRSGSKDGTYTLLGTTTAINYTDSKANAGYTYYYKVKAVSKVKTAANSYYSTAVAGTCHCARPTVTPDYLASTGKPYIKWTAVAGASQYEVYRSGSKDGTYTLLGTTTATNYTDSKANAGYTYYYKVKAVSKVKTAANSYYSTAVAATCHCARPSVKITTTSAGKPRLTWDAVAGASQYEIYRATSQNGTYTKMYTTTALSYTNTSAKADTTYYYKVKAVSKVKSTANSSFSTVVSIKAK